MKRLLGIDVGRRRVGVALSDPCGLLATGLTVIDVKKKNAIDEIDRLARTHGVEMAVVGLPLNADGSSGPAVDMVRAFGAALERRTGLRVAYVDERYTSVVADEAMVEGRVAWRRRKELVDKLAAQLILQRYLDEALGS